MTEPPEPQSPGTCTLMTKVQEANTGADAKMAAARGMIEQAAQRWPGVWDFLDRSGLGNSPHLIEQLAARATRRART